MQSLREYLFVPPVLSAPLLVLLWILGGANVGETMPLPVWIVLLGGYVGASATYVVLLLRGATASLLQLQLLAQGICVAAAALSLGTSTLVAWSGAILFLAGATMIAYNGAQGAGNGKKPRSVGGKDLFAKIVSLLPFPMLYTDQSGVVQAASPAMVEFGASRTDRVTGAPVGEVIPLSEAEISFRGVEWTIEQQVLPDEGMFLFYMLPKAETEEDRKRKQRASEDSPLLESRTGLYSDAYVRVRCEEELARGHRYRRWMTAVLLRLDLRGVVSEGEEQAVREQLGKHVKDAIRSCDVGFRMKNGNILLLLPETPLGGAQTLVKRIKEKVDLLMGTLAKSGMTYPFDFRVGYYFFKGTEPVHVHSLLGLLEGALRLYSEGEAPKDSGEQGG